MAEGPQTRRELLEELEELTVRLREAEQTLEAIRGGAVDALVVETPQGGQQLFTLQGADHVYRVFLESIAEGALTLSGDGTVLYANPAAVKMLSATGKSVTGTSLRGWLAHECRRSFDGLIDAGRQGLVSTETRLCAQAGGRPAYLSIRPCVDLGETVMVAVLTDLTRQKKTEKLVEEERLARSILEQAGEAIIVCDRRGVVIRASRSVRELAGLEPLFRRADDVLRLRTDNGEEWRAPCMEATPVRRLYQLPVWLDRADGKPARLLLNLDPLETREDGVIGAVMTLTDVTRQHEAEEALREGEERLAIALQAASLGVYDYDLRSGTIRCDDRTGEIVGEAGGATLATEEVLVRLVHPDDRERVREELVQALQPSGNGRYAVTMRLFRLSDGEERWVSGAGRVFFEGGQAVRVVGTLEDITERVHLSQALVEREADEAARQERNRFARDLHDSVTQTLFAAALKAEALTAMETQDETRAAIAEELRRLSRGAFAQMRTLLFELRPESLDGVPLAQLLRNLAEGAESRSMVRVECRFSGETEPAPEVHAALYRVAAEALNNIVRHSRAHQAWVELKLAQDSATMVVGDDGRGFDRDGVDSGHFGLQSMRERAEEVGARFSIVTAPGEGTLVVVGWHAA